MSTSNGRKRLYLQCDSGDRFGSVTVPDDLEPDTVFVITRCRSRRHEHPDGWVTLHKFDAATGEFQTWSSPKQQADDSAEE